MSLFPSQKFAAVCGCLSVILLGLLAPVRVLAEETKVRLAVIGDADSRDLSALIVAELSSRPDVALVEREDLSRLGDEQQLQRLAGSDAVALGKLVGADGLLFVDKTAAGYTARFTAVGLGYALFDDGLGMPKDQGQLARSLAHRVVGYASKLRLDPAKTTPLSILNLRADLATTQSTALERDLTLLLESRLASVPGYVVLERRHAWSLGFEHGLDPAARSLLHGAYLIDGTLSLAAGGDLTVALRVRAPGWGESTAPVRGTVGDLTALVDRTLSVIARATGQPLATPASTDAEAEEYLREGLWGWRSEANQAALEALDSAELLGAPVAAVEAVRVPVLYALVDAGMERWTPWFDEEKKTPAFDPAALAGKADLALRLIREAVRYHDEKLEDQLPPDLAVSPTEKFLFKTREIQDRTIYRASKLLLLLDREPDSRADELRRALRALTGYDPLHGQPGRETATNVNNDVSRAVFADDWAQTLEEELAYYRLVCTDKVMALPTSQVAWNNARFGKRFLKDPQKCQAAFAAFANALADDPACRLSGLILKTHLDDQTADEAYRALLGEFWTQRENLATAKTNLPVLRNLYWIPSSVKERRTLEGLPLLRYVLTYPQPGSWCFTLVGFLWQPENFPRSETPAIWKEFGAFRERLRPVWLAEKHGEKSFDRQTGEMAAALRAKFPDAVGESAKPLDASSVALAVTKFWHPWLTPAGAAEGDFIINAMETVPDGGMWLAGYFSHGIKGRLFKIALPDLSMEVVALPEDKMARSIQVGPDALYANRTSNGGKEGAESHNYLSRYDLATHAWETREMPIQFRQDFSLLHNCLYLTVSAFGGGYGEKESGLARYDWAADRVTILADSRRRPGQSQFDDTAPYEVERVFLGPGDRPCVATGKGIFYVREEAGEWPRVFDGTFADYVTTALDRTLVHNRNHEITVLDPQMPAPVHVMAAKEPIHRHGPALEPSPWTGQTWWDNPGEVEFSGLAIHGDCLFALVQPRQKRGTYELWCYRRGEGRQPRKVPLQFQMDPAASSTLPPRPGHMPNGWSIDEMEHPDTSVVPLKLITTGQGLCLGFISAGFWFLPYEDIAAYLKTGRN